jgi:hypothetical protein
MVKSCVLFAVRTEFLNIIQMSFSFKGSNILNQYLSVCGLFSVVVSISDCVVLDNRMINELGRLWKEAAVA